MDWLTRLAVLLTLQGFGISARADLTASPPRLSADQTLVRILESLQGLSLGGPDLTTRIQRATQSFLGQPYLFGGALGEGSAGHFDQSPLYRFDGFDCTTFVETAIALALAADPSDFHIKLKTLRYREDRADFVTRNHFVTQQWNPQAQLHGFLRDVTRSIGGTRTQIATSRESIREWFQNLPPRSIKLAHASAQEKTSRLIEIRQAGMREEFAARPIEIDYLPNALLLKEELKIPSPAVLNIVRTHWRPRAQKNRNFGTDLLISHQVLLLKENGRTFIRQASSRPQHHRSVVDMPFADFVKELSHTPKVVGVNIQQILNGN